MRSNRLNYANYGQLIGNSLEMKMGRNGFFFVLEMEKCNTNLCDALPRSALHKMLSTEYHQHVNAAIVKHPCPIFYHPDACVLMYKFVFEIENVRIVWRQFHLVCVSCVLCIYLLWDLFFCSLHKIDVYKWYIFLLLLTVIAFFVYHVWQGCSAYQRFGSLFAFMVREAMLATKWYCVRVLRMKWKKNILFIFGWDLLLLLLLLHVMYVCMGVIYSSDSCFILHIC